MLLAARAQRGPQWDIGTQLFLVDQGSDAYYDPSLLVEKPDSPADGAAAASAAALASPCKASIGAFRLERGSVSSDSSSDEGAVLGTIPYVAYLWGYSTIKTP